MSAMVIEKLSYHKYVGLFDNVWQDSVIHKPCCLPIIKKL